ncbi:hypothetical protein GCM10012285_27770 [Streptomyces kronopolitis]|uniref:HTH marR-type domain-containing protein n=1 Tax=Streptomyces kronopolitis TaxID=1612435 RepID=A0ABQ2JEF0_9ACTN|nr:hypothetical protein GCM10012285_27770 [Streptomyces kronopolitis]
MPSQTTSRARGTIQRAQRDAFFIHIPKAINRQGLCQSSSMSIIEILYTGQMRSTGAPSRSLPSEDPAGLQAFAVLLRRMNGEFNRIAQEFARAQGLHLTDVQALIAVLDDNRGKDAGPMTPGRLRKQLNLTSGAMTTCLDRLEKVGHIRRVRAADDRRVVHLHYAEAATHPSPA